MSSKDSKLKTNKPNKPNKPHGQLPSNKHGFKLPPIPKGAKVHKRPLPRRQQPPSSKSRLIYASSSTSLLSIVKRTRKHLDRFLAARGPATRGMSVHDRVEALRERAAAVAGPGLGLDGGSEGGEGAEVLVLGTGRAIEKVLDVAAWFVEAGDCAVEVRTRTVGAIDDIVASDRKGTGDEMEIGSEGTPMERDEEEEGGRGEDEAESRVRKVSCLEATIRLR